MNGQPDLILAEGVDREEVHLMIQAFAEVANRFRQADPEDFNITGKVMCALSMVAGAMCGALIGIGVLPRQHQRAMVDNSARNFREGIKAGQAKIERIKREAATIQ